MFHADNLISCLMPFYVFILTHYLQVLCCDTYFLPMRIDQFLFANCFSFLMTTADSLAINTIQCMFRSVRD